MLFVQYMQYTAACKIMVYLFANDEKSVGSYSNSYQYEFQ